MPVSFRIAQPIHQQIGNYLYEQILGKEIVAGGKLLSIRQLAAQLKVNPSTILRAYQVLAQQAVIDQKRGMSCPFSSKPSMYWAFALTSLNTTDQIP